MAVAPFIENESTTSALRADRAARRVSWTDWVQQAPPTRTSGPSGRVLLVSYLFPPTGGSGVYRPLGLVRDLPRFGWQVEVLTAAHARFPWRDDTLIERVPQECAVHRVAGHEPACWAHSIAAWCWPPYDPDAPHTTSANSRDQRTRQWIDDRIYWRLARQTQRLGLDNGESLWVRPAVRQAMALHKTSPFDAVISTGPPHFVHEVGLRFSQHTGVPWLADLRDPLVSDFDRTAAHAQRDERMRRLQGRITAHARAIITTSATFAAELAMNRQGATAPRITCITNGFDREELQRVGYLVSARDWSGCCEFVYAGSCYGRREVAKLVEPFTALLKRRPDLRGQFRLTVAGELDRQQQDLWRVNREPWLELTGYVSRLDALRRSAEAACNLVVVPDCAHGRSAIPGKTFDLLALPRHVLGLAPPRSETAQIIRQAGASSIAPFEDVQSASEAIEQIIDAFHEQRLSGDRDWEQLDKFDRSETASRVATVLSETAASRVRAQVAADKAPTHAQVVLE